MPDVTRYALVMPSDFAEQVRKLKASERSEAAHKEEFAVSFRTALKSYLDSISPDFAREARIRKIKCNWLGFVADKGWGILLPIPTQIPAYGGEPAYLTVLIKRDGSWRVDEAKGEIDSDLPHMYRYKHENHKIITGSYFRPVSIPTYEQVRDSLLETLAGRNTLITGVYH